MDGKQLGERIRRQRLIRNLTLKDVEREAKVSATHISEIERGLTSPTVGALSRIAHAIETDAPRLLAEDPSPRVRVVRSDQRRALDVSSWSARIERLAGGIADGEITMFEVSVQPGRHEPVGSLSQRGETFLHMLGGVVEVSVDTESRTLKTGDSVHMATASFSGMRNIGDGVARVLWVTTPEVNL